MKFCKRFELIHAIKFIDVILSRSFSNSPMWFPHGLLFCLIWFFTSQSIIFQLCQDGSSWVRPVLYLAHGHKTVTPLNTLLIKYLSPQHAKGYLGGGEGGFNIRSWQNLYRIFYCCSRASHSYCMLKEGDGSCLRTEARRLSKVLDRYRK